MLTLRQAALLLVLGLLMAVVTLVISLATSNDSSSEGRAFGLALDGILLLIVLGFFAIAAYAYSFSARWRAVTRERRLTLDAGHRQPSPAN
jgi:hypothetical protein